jgi:hypothetical protein
MRRPRILIIPITFLIVAALACTSPLSPPRLTPTPRPTSTPYPTQILPTQIPTQAGPPTPTPLPGPFGPTGYPPNVDPLTGQIVADPSVLNRRPLLIKVSNESPKVRPQSGLSFADNVWEYQMEGYAQTRFTAVYYSQTPDRVGSVRSARLIDVENLVDMYGGILVYSGGSSNRYAPGTPPRVDEMVNASPWVKRVVTQDYLPRVGVSYDAPYFKRLDFPSAAIPEYHKLFTFPAQVWNLAVQKGLNDRPNLDGLVFNYTAPGGGAPATKAIVDYPGKGPKHTWNWDAGSGTWLSSTEDQEAGTPEAPDMDLLTGKPLGFDNVVIVQAQESNADFLEEEPTASLPEGLASVRIVLNGQGLCTLLRDGQRFDCIWKRADKGGMMQFFDVNNNPMPFKPGNTFFNVVSSTYAKPTVTFAP